MLYIRLYLEFFKIGLFSIGGGLATLPFLQELASKYAWITSEELLNMIAISESTPGPIGVNTATFVGYNTAGFFGGIIATIGLATPSVIIIAIIAHYFMKFNEHHLVQGAFLGVRPAVTGLIASVAFEVGKDKLFNLQYFNLDDFLNLFNVKAILFFAVLFYLIYKYKKHPILYIIAAAVIGVIFKF